MQNIISFIGLFCKKNYSLIDPTNRSHPIACSCGRIQGLLRSVARNTQKHTETHRNTQKRTETYRNTQKHTETHRNTQKHTETHRNTQKHTETHGNTQKHTETHRNALTPAAYCEWKEPGKSLTLFGTGWLPLVGSLKL